MCHSRKLQRNRHTPPPQSRQARQQHHHPRRKTGGAEDSVRSHGGKHGKLKLRPHRCRKTTAEGGGEETKAVFIGASEAYARGKADGSVKQSMARE